MACGNAGCSGGLVVTTFVCFTTLCARGCGCSGHPAFPTPSVIRGKLAQTSGASRREIADAHLVVIARSEATKQSILSLRGEMDCFAEFIIGRAFARPVGSQ